MGIQTKKNKKARAAFIALAAVSFLIMGTVWFTSCENIAAESGDALAARAAGAAPPNAIPISTRDDLEAIELSPGDDYVLVNDLDLTDLTDWTPICDNTNPFTGTFDGGNYTITINGFSGAGAYLGIFAVTQGAAIEDLTVNINTGAITSSTIQYVGGVAGSATNTECTNITVSGTVNVTYNGANSAALNVGGVAGYTSGGSINAATVSAAFTATTTANGIPVYIGGAAGKAAGTTFTDCAYTGIGSITGVGNGYNVSAGGIVGYMTQGYIFQSYATGNITLTGLWDSSYGEYDLWQIYAGGLAGYSGDASRIVRCYATGVVSATSPYPYAGGLVGYHYGDFSSDDPERGSFLSECYALGAVSASCTKGSNGLPYAGGLAGYSSKAGCLIENSYATGEVRAETTSKYSWAGGLIGCNARDSVVYNCYARGAVLALAGDQDLPYPQPNIDPGASSGGIAGYNYNYDQWVDTIILGCVALNGSISAKATGTTPVNVYRVVGHNGTTPAPAILRYNYGSEDMVLAPAHSPLDPDLDGADCDAQPPRNFYLTRPLTWDFIKVWKMSGGYPVLQWQP